MSVLKMGLMCDTCFVLFDRKPGESTYDLRMRARDKDGWAVNVLQRSCEPGECDHLRPHQRADFCDRCMWKGMKEAVRKIERGQRARDGFNRIV